MNIDKVMEAAQRVLQAREDLRRAEEDFQAAVKGSPVKAPAMRPKGKSGAGPSVSQRVIGLIANSGPSGIARKDMVAVIGKDHETAIHSALKVHQGKGLVSNKDGHWVATAKLVRQMQAPPTKADDALLRAG